MSLRVGTRSSPLALAQAGGIADRIGGELVEITTGGDRGIGEDKGRWVDEIEAALLDRRIDLAVHSAKDVPGELAGGLSIIGAPARADPRDALCGAASIAALAPAARVGTSSLRRSAQLRASRPDLEIAELRGNVGSRLKRLEQGDYDAIVLARAGLQRLGLDAGEPLEELVPAPGQGTLALEARCDDGAAAAAIAPLRDRSAEQALLAERTLVRALGAGCDTPLGAHCSGDTLRAFVGLPDGSAWIRDELTGGNPAEIGREMGRRMLAAGAKEMLRQ
ncbi:MAG: hydroxymethylbilane synthase [Solirubrobacteraceae bacterium]